MLAAERPSVRAAAVYSMTFEYDGWNMPRFAVAAPVIQLVANLPGVRRLAWAETHPFGLKDERLRGLAERAPGGLFLAYLGLYSLGRFWIEGLRTDSHMLGSFRIAQIVSVTAVVVAVVGIPILLRRRRT